MKKIVISILALMLIIPVYSRSRAGSITLPSIPDSVASFKAMRNELAKTPKGGAAMFIAAMIKYSQNKEMGIKFFTLIFDRYYIGNARRGPSVRGYAPNRAARSYIRYLRAKPYLGKVYIQGTNHRNAYKLPSAPYKITFNQIRKGRRAVTLYVNTTSGNLARPIKLKKNNRGIWKAYGVSSLFVGVRHVPRRVQDDDL